MARILIVDDEKHIRTHLATYFRGGGHEVETAADAAAALAAVRAVRVRRGALRRPHGGHGRHGAAASRFAGATPKPSSC